MTSPGIVVVTSGHLVDEPRRTPPRFPPEAEPRVGAALGAILRDWGVGPGSVVFTQGARGADIMVAEKALELRADVRLLLALPPEDFESTSVALPRSHWVRRFRRLIERCSTTVQGEAIGPPGDENPFARNNRRVLAEAVGAAAAMGAEVRALVVWDGEPAEGGGGTADFVSEARTRSIPVHVVDPRATYRQGNVPYWEKQWPAEKKRMLALDGGGVRGVISLVALRRMQDILGPGDQNFVLGDWFDYIAGTSTGAIIATALSCGIRVEAIEALYRDLAPAIFRKRILLARLRSLYDDDELREKFERCFGVGRTFGSDDLRALLLVVTHRVDTDSIWPLSNNTWGLYNDPTAIDCNLAFPLARIIRGSAAAPVFFTPEEISLGGRTALFEDGGVTPFNNPALLLFEMATSPRYRLGWPTGADKLLLVSVGTGFAPAAHPGLSLRRATLPFQGKNLLKVIMNGSSTENDRLCRVLGECRHGPTLDSEFDEEAVDKTPIASLFTYVRYNADLSAGGLARMGLGHLDPKRVSRLDAVEAIDDLAAIGAKVAGEVAPAHFAGF